MKVFVLEFSFFCGGAWTNKTVEITATNKVQLMKAFLREARFVNGEARYERRKKTPKDVWNEYKSNIREEILTFPIVTEKEY